VLVDLAVFVDPVRWRSLSGLFAMAHEHDDFRGLVPIHHVTPLFSSCPGHSMLAGGKYCDVARLIKGTVYQPVPDRRRMAADPAARQADESDITSPKTITRTT
jgi:hypothetical protein